MPAQAPSPTASAVVGDILSLSEQISRGVAPLPEIEPYGHNLAFKPMDELQTKYYVRLKVADRVGALSETVDIFAKHNISISLINQVEGRKSGVSDACSVIFLTHRALEKDVQLPPPSLPASTAWPRSPTSYASRTLRLGPKASWPTSPLLRTSTKLNAKGALPASTAGSAPSILWTEPVSRHSLLLAVVIPGLIACIELQHAAAVFAHGGAWRAPDGGARGGQLGWVDLVSIGLIGK